MRKLITFVLALLVSFAVVSCVTTRHDNGKHKGWYKNPNNPHHPLSGKKKKKKPKKEYKIFDFDKHPRHEKAGHKQK